MNRSSSSSSSSSRAVDIDSRLNDRLNGKSSGGKLSGMPRSSLNSESDVGLGKSNGLRRSDGKTGSKSCLKKSRSSDGSSRRKSSRGKKQVKRSISFDKYDAIFEIEHVDDIPEHTKNEIWMKPEESRQIRQEAIEIVEQLNDYVSNGSSSIDGSEHGTNFDDSTTQASLDDVIDELDSSTCTFRGLECHTDVAIQKRLEYQDGMYDAVLKLQEFQQKRGINLPNAMADVCRKQTAKARQDAYEKAVKDALAIAYEP